jgi:hypothetical protein
MSVFLSPNLPANVVEIGNEISQAKINEINAGTLATQTWVTTGFAPKASPTFTGTVTIPAGASISGYATQSYVTGLGYITDAPSNGSQYARQNGAWAVVTGGGGGGISDAPADGYSYVRRMSAWISVGSSTYETVATQEWVNALGHIADAPSDGNEYVRKNAAWSIATGGGGGISVYDNGVTYVLGTQVVYNNKIFYLSTYVGGAGYDPINHPSYWTEISATLPDAPSDGNLYARQNAGWTSFTIPTLSVTNIDLTGNFNGYSMGSGYYSFKYDSSANTLRMQDGYGSGVTVSATGITFPDSTTLTTAPTLVDAPSDGNYYVRRNGAWHQCQIANVYDNSTMSNQDVLRT